MGPYSPKPFTTNHEPQTRNPKPQTTNHTRQPERQQHRQPQQPQQQQAQAQAQAQPQPQHEQLFFSTTSTLKVGHHSPKLGHTNPTEQTTNNKEQTTSSCSLLDPYHLNMGPWPAVARKRLNNGD